MNKIYYAGPFVVLKTESTSYQSASGKVIAPQLQKGGAGLRGTVLVSGNGFEKGDKVEFQRNLGVEIRENIYAVKITDIFFKGDLDEYLKTDNYAE